MPRNAGSAPSAASTASLARAPAIARVPDRTIDMGGNMVRIFVPQAIPEVAVERMKQLGEVSVYAGTDGPIPHAELVEAVRDKDILYAMGEIEYDRAVIAAAKPLKMVAAMHMKATFVDQKACTERGVPVSGLPNFVAKTTAEFTFAMIMAAAWNLQDARRFLEDGRWTQNQSTAFLGTRLFGKTLGIVGMGTVGSHVARRAAASEMKIIYNKRSRLGPAEEFALGNAEYRSLEDLFAQSDFVSINAGLTAATRGLVGEELISLMKPSAILVNTARGAILDEAALERALREGRIRGAALDVFEVEVPEPGPGPRKGLYQLPNVVLTPHIGSAARETREEMALRTVSNIERFLAGKRPFDVLNPEVYGEAARNEEVIG
jgi:lactate dehydrogenase-like 2-hydroxyacid dehydrogenase